MLPTTPDRYYTLFAGSDPVEIHLWPYSVPGLGHVLEDLVKVYIHRLPSARKRPHTLILRRGSLILVSDAPPSAAIQLDRHMTGHDAIAEIGALDRDFPGLFSLSA